jgi:putative transposase
MPQSQDQQEVELTCPKVLELTVKTLMEHLDLTVKSNQYTQQDIWRVLASASAQATTVEDVTRKLEDAPCANTVRGKLKEGLLTKIDLRALEDKINELLIAHLPPRIIGYRHRIAVDLVFLPYYGEPAQDPKELRRSRANRGTTRFHCYATAYLIKHNKRVTLAMTYVRAEDTLLEVLKRLLSRLEEIGVGLRRLYLDRSFYSVEIIRFLKGQPFPSIIPAKVNGKRMESLCQGRKSYRTTYKVISPKQGGEEVDLWIVCRYAKGKRGKHKVEHLPYVVIGDMSCPIPNVRKEHRGRFGVESSYRMMNKARARTTCRDPKYRLLLVGLALSLINIWIALKWKVLGMPRKGGRWIKDDLFPLSLFRAFIIEAMKTIYGFVWTVQRPPPAFRHP